MVFYLISDASDLVKERQMTTRRNLLKSSLSLAAAPVGMSVAIEVAHAEDMPKWNNETGVLVLGYGNA